VSVCVKEGLGKEGEREKGGREKGKGSKIGSLICQAVQLNALSKAGDSHNAFLPYRYNASLLINARQTKFRSAEIRDTRFSLPL